VKQPAGFVVEQDDGAVAVDGEDAVAHVADHVPEEHVFLPRRFRLALCHLHCCRAGLSKAHAPYGDNDLTL
jgi:hypothetical protein